MCGFDKNCNLLQLLICTDSDESMNLDKKLCTSLFDDEKHFVFAACLQKWADDIERLYAYFEIACSD